MAFKLRGPALYKNKYGKDGLVDKDIPELDLSEREDPYVTSRIEAQKKLDSINKMKSSPLDKYASAAQRRAVWANKADGGAGHPDQK